MSPASGDLQYLELFENIVFLVSIQLMSPASGDQILLLEENENPKVLACFHSINVPSEWGPYKMQVSLKI